MLLAEFGYGMVVLPAYPAINVESTVAPSAQRPT